MKKFLNLFVLATLFLFAGIQVDASIEPQPQESFISLPAPDIPVMDQSITFQNVDVSKAYTPINESKEVIPLDSHLPSANGITLTKCQAINRRPITVNIRTRSLDPLPKSITAQSIPLNRYDIPPLS